MCIKSEKLKVCQIQQERKKGLAIQCLYQHIDLCLLGLDSIMEFFDRFNQWSDKVAVLYGFVSGGITMHQLRENLLDLLGDDSDISTIRETIVIAIAIQSQDLVK